MDILEVEEDIYEIANSMSQVIENIMKSKSFIRLRVWKMKHGFEEVWWSAQDQIYFYYNTTDRKVYVTIPKKVDNYVILKKRNLGNKIKKHDFSLTEFNKPKLLGKLINTWLGESYLPNN